MYFFINPTGMCFLLFLYIIKTQNMCFTDCCFSIYLIQRRCSY
jgi:hypothetical protein